MTAEELMYQAEHMRLENPNDGTRLLFFALQAQAIIAEQLTRIADSLETIQRVGMPVEDVNRK